MEVPAESEIVIEGTVLPGVREEEGPFGEFTCFISGEGRNPVWDVSAITMRHDPIFRHIQATEFTEHQVLCGLPMEAVIYSRIKDVNGGIELYDVHVPPWASQWVTIVQMTAHYEGQVKDVLMNALSSPYLHPKIAIAVDSDVNIYDPADMMWAISTRVIRPRMSRASPIAESIPWILPARRSALRVKALAANRRQNDDRRNHAFHFQGPGKK